MANSNANANAKCTDLSCLPTLTIDDISREIRTHAVSVEGVAVEAVPSRSNSNVSGSGVESVAARATANPTSTVSASASSASKSASSTTTTTAQVPVQWRTTATNGVSYVTIARSVRNLPNELKAYLPIFCSALTSVGTTTHPLPTLDEQIRSNTGGISVSYTATTSPCTPLTTSEMIYLTSNCLDSASNTKTVSTMYELLTDIILNPRWDADGYERLRTVVLSSASGAGNGIVEQGHAYAMGAAVSGLRVEGGGEGEGRTNEALELQELTGGLTQVMMLNGLAGKILGEGGEAGVEALKDVEAKLKAIAEYLLTSNETEITRCAITCMDEAKERQESNLRGLLERVGWTGGQRDLYSQNPTPLRLDLPSRLLFPIPAGVNYTAKAFPGVPYSHPDAAALQILSSLLSTNFLHRELREKGGAYGGGAQYSSLDGYLCLWSYRDPPQGLQRTLETYEKAAEWGAGVKGRVGQRELDEAKLSIFSALDRPVSASDEGITLFRYGITDEMRQRRRDQLFAVTSDDVERVAKQVFYGPASKGSRVAVLGSDKEGAEFVEAANAKMEGTDGEAKWEVMRG
ncbi:Mitochondrial presequence protease [Quaeritorhiza haematococci]|nr:Mitochondrial presequence protease [Quaeritorhiza haematococci]